MKTKIKITFTLVIIAQLFLGESFGQSTTSTKLFQQQEVLSMRMSLSFKEIKKNTTDSTFIPSMLYYKQGDTWDSIKINVRARGQFRKKECFFTPLHIKIKDSHGTLFEGNKSLKLVLPCEISKDNNKLLIKEYICYKLYDEISPYTFSTRLVNIDLKETSGNKPKNFPVYGFFIEDDDLVAKKHNAKVIENLNLHPLALRDTFAIQHDLFQYMISNTDWSTTYLHNAKLIKIEPNTFIPLAYDFDMAGFVDAPYAVVDATLNVASVKDRVYRGFCRKNESALQSVRRQYINSEIQLKNVIGLYSNYFEPKEFASINAFIDEFFLTLKSDTNFRNSIIEKCRTK